MKKLLLIATTAIAGVGLSACAPMLAAGAGAAAATVYNDDNTVCDPPTDAGLLDDDC